MSNRSHFFGEFVPDTFIGDMNSIDRAKHTRQQTACKKFTVKWCDSCKQAWERAGKPQYYGSNFPKHGLEHIICPTCKRGN